MLSSGYRAFMKPVNLTSSFIVLSGSSSPPYIAEIFLVVFFFLLLALPAPVHRYYDYLFLDSETNVAETAIEAAIAEQETEVIEHDENQAVYAGESNEGPDSGWPSREEVRVSYEPLRAVPSVAWDEGQYGPEVPPAQYSKSAEWPEFVREDESWEFDTGYPQGTKALLSDGTDVLAVTREDYSHDQPLVFSVTAQDVSAPDAYWNDPPVVPPPKSSSRKRGSAAHHSELADRHQDLPLEHEPDQQARNETHDSYVENTVQKMKRPRFDPASNVSKKTSKPKKYDAPIINDVNASLEREAPQHSRGGETRSFNRFTIPKASAVVEHDQHELYDNLSSDRKHSGVNQAQEEDDEDAEEAETRKQSLADVASGDKNRMHLSINQMSEDIAEIRGGSNSDRELTRAVVRLYLEECARTSRGSQSANEANTEDEEEVVLCVHHYNEICPEEVLSQARAGASGSGNLPPCHSKGTRQQSIPCASLSDVIQNPPQFTEVQESTMDSPKGYKHSNTQGVEVHRPSGPPRSKHSVVHNASLKALTSQLPIHSYEVVDHQPSDSVTTGTGSMHVTGSYSTDEPMQQHSATCTEPQDTTYRLSASSKPSDTLSLTRTLEHQRVSSLHTGKEQVQPLEIPNVLTSNVSKPSVAPLSRDCGTLEHKTIASLHAREEQVQQPETLTLTEVESTNLQAQQASVSTSSKVTVSTDQESINPKRILGVRSLKKQTQKPNSIHHVTFSGIQSPSQQPEQLSVSRNKTAISPSDSMLSNEEALYIRGKQSTSSARDGAHSSNSIPLQKLSGARLSSSGRFKSMLSKFRAIFKRSRLATEISGSKTNHETCNVDQYSNVDGISESQQSTSTQASDVISPAPIQRHESQCGANLTARSTHGRLEDYTRPLQSSPARSIQLASSIIQETASRSQADDEFELEINVTPQAEHSPPRGHAFLVTPVNTNDPLAIEPTSTITNLAERSAHAAGSTAESGVRSLTNNTLTSMRTSGVRHKTYHQTLLANTETRGFDPALSGVHQWSSTKTPSAAQTVPAERSPGSKYAPSAQTSCPSSQSAFKKFSKMQPGSSSPHVIHARDTGFTSSSSCGLIISDSSHKKLYDQSVLQAAGIILPDDHLPKENFSCLSQGVSRDNSVVNKNNKSRVRHKDSSSTNSDTSSRTLSHTCQYPSKETVGSASSKTHHRELQSLNKSSTNCVQNVKHPTTLKSPVISNDSAQDSQAVSQRQSHSGKQIKRPPMTVSQRNRGSVLSVKPSGKGSPKEQTGHGMPNMTSVDISGTTVPLTPEQILANVSSMIQYYNLNFASSNSGPNVNTPAKTDPQKNLSWRRFPASDHDVSGPKLETTSPPSGRAVSMHRGRSPATPRSEEHHRANLEHQKMTSHTSGTTTRSSTTKKQTTLTKLEKFTRSSAPATSAQHNDLPISKRVPPGLTPKTSPSQENQTGKFNNKLELKHSRKHATSVRGISVSPAPGSSTFRTHTKPSATSGSSVKESIRTSKLSNITHGKIETTVSNVSPNGSKEKHPRSLVAQYVSQRKLTSSKVGGLELTETDSLARGNKPVPPTNHQPLATSKCRLSAESSSAHHTVTLASTSVHEAGPSSSSETRNSITSHHVKNQRAGSQPSGISMNREKPGRPVNTATSSLVGPHSKSVSPETSAKERLQSKLTSPAGSTQSTGSSNSTRKPANSRFPSISARRLGYEANRSKAQSTTSKPLTSSTKALVYSIGSAKQSGGAIMKESVPQSQLRSPTSSKQHQQAGTCIKQTDSNTCTKPPSNLHTNLYPKCSSSISDGSTCENAASPSASLKQESALSVETPSAAFTPVNLADPSVRFGRESSKADGSDTNGSSDAFSATSNSDVNQSTSSVVSSETSLRKEVTAGKHTPAAGLTVEVSKSNSEYLSSDMSSDSVNSSHSQSSTTTSSLALLGMTPSKNTVIFPGNKPGSIPFRESGASLNRDTSSKSWTQSINSTMSNDTAASPCSTLILRTTSAPPELTSPLARSAVYSIGEQKSAEAASSPCLPLAEPSELPAAAISDLHNSLDLDVSGENVQKSADNQPNNNLDFSIKGCELQSQSSGTLSDVTLKLSREPVLQLVSAPTGTFSSSDSVYDAPSSADSVPLSTSTSPILADSFIKPIINSKVSPIDSVTAKRSVRYARTSASVFLEPSARSTVSPQNISVAATTNSLSDAHKSPISEFASPLTSPSEVSKFFFGSAIDSTGFLLVPSIHTVSDADANPVSSLIVPENIVPAKTNIATESSKSFVRSLIDSEILQTTTDKQLALGSQIPTVIPPASEQATPAEALKPLPETARQSSMLLVAGTSSTSSLAPVDNTQNTSRLDGTEKDGIDHTKQLTLGLNACAETEHSAQPSTLDQTLGSSRLKAFLQTIKKTPVALFKAREGDKMKVMWEPPPQVEERCASSKREEGLVSIDVELTIVSDTDNKAPPRPDMAGEKNANNDNTE